MMLIVKIHPGNVLFNTEIYKSSYCSSFKPRYEYAHVSSKATKRKNPPPPHHIRVTHGAVHVIATRAFVEFAINNQTAKDFQKWLNSTFIPDELYFSSLNSSPELNVPGAYKGRRYVHHMSVKGTTSWVW